VSDKIRESELAVQNQQWRKDMSDVGLPDEVWKIKPSENIKGLTWRDAYFQEVQDRAEVVDELHAEGLHLRQQVAGLQDKIDNWNFLDTREVAAWRESIEELKQRSSFTLLADHYRTWVMEEHLPQVSADEQDRMVTSEYQDAYLNRFIELWDVIQEKHNG
jgi:hypothetical protein